MKNLVSTRFGTLFHPSTRSVLFNALLLGSLFTVYSLPIGASGIENQVIPEEQITADRSWGQRKTGTIQYSGNVKYQSNDIQMQAEQLTITKDDNQQRELVAKGSPVNITQIREAESLHSRADSLRYYPDSNQIQTNGNVRFWLTQPKKSDLKILADNLTYSLNTSSNSEEDFVHLNADGNPVTIELNDTDARITATAHKLIYSSVNGDLILEQGVVFRQEQDIIRAEKMIYNLSTQEWHIPAQKDKQLEVIKNPAL